MLPSGHLTEGDLNSLFPFKNNFLIRLKARGRDIRQALELGVADLPKASRNLLHASGLRYRVNLSKQPLIMQKSATDKTMKIKQAGQRVVNVNVLQRNNSFSPLQDEREYEVIISSMMIDDSFFGAFFMFKSIKDMHKTDMTDKKILISYFKNHKTVSPCIVGQLHIEKMAK